MNFLNLFSLLVVAVINIEKLTSFDSIKEAIIANQRTAAIKERFATMAVMDTYFFSANNTSTFEKESISVEWITGRRNLSLTTISSLMANVNSIISLKDIVDMDFKLKDNNGELEWVNAFMVSEPSCVIEVTYSSSEQNVFFGNIVVNSTGETDGMECRVVIKEFADDSCVSGLHFQEDIIQHVGLFNGKIVDVPAP